MASDGRIPRGFFPGALFHRRDQVFVHEPFGCFLRRTNRAHQFRDRAIELLLMGKSLRGVFAFACPEGSDTHRLVMHARLGERCALSERALTLPEFKPTHRSQYRVRIQPRLQFCAALRNQATQLNRT